MLLFKRESLDGLDESLQALYEQRDGAFFLKVQGAVAEDELQGIKANRDALLAEKKEQQRIAAEAEAERQRIEREALEAQARKNGDLEAIEASWREKLTTTEQTLKAQLEEAQRKNYELTVGRQAQELAGKLAKPNAQRLLAKEIKERLTLDENGNLRVLDTQGKPTALTVQELEAELRANPEYQDIIIISSASGGGATGGLGGGADKNPKDMTEQDRRDLKARDPELFRQRFLSNRG